MANNPKNQDENNDSATSGQVKKELMCTGVYGKVKWFNVKRGYGFVCRNDNQEDVFIHQSAIVKHNPEHQRKSVGENEEIQFDIVKGIKGNEAANVCGADGNHVKGSEYALRYQRGGRFRGRGRGRGRSRGPSEELDNSHRPQEFARGGSPRGGGGGGGRPFRGARPYNNSYRSQYPNYDMPPPPPPQQMYYGYDYDYYRGPVRGRGGYRGNGGGGGRSFRGGPPQREAQMEYPAYEFEYERRPRGGRGRSRFRGGRGWRGGRGSRGGPHENDRVKDEGEETHGEEHHAD